MHHKLLLGSTALVGAGLVLATASPARAQIEVVLGGYTEFGVSIAEDDLLTGSDRGYGFYMDTEIVPSVLATSDAGIEYGGKVELEVFESAGFEEAGEGDTIADEAVLFFSGAFGRLELGREDGAEDVMFVGGEDTQAGTGGIDGDTANLIPFSTNDSSDAAKVTYFTPRVGGFQLGGSYAIDTGDDFGDDSDDPTDFSDFVGGGANWTGEFGGLAMTLSGVVSWAEAEVGAVDDLLDWAVGFNTEILGFEVGASYVQRTDFAEAQIINAGLGFGVGPANASVGWAWHDPDDADDQMLFAVSGDVGILPGVVLKGDVTYNTDTFDGTADGDETWAGVVTVQLNY